MNENLKRYLKIQVDLGKIKKEAVIAKYPEMEIYLNAEEE